MILNPEQKDIVNKHILASYPNEGVLFVLDNGDVLPVENISQNPTSSFKVDKTIYLKNKVAGIIHSHIVKGHSFFDWRSPSYSDFKQQQMTNIPWGIVETEGENVSDVLWFPVDRNYPLLNRPFIYYVFDCWTLVRDWYWQERKVDLLYYPDIDLTTDGVPDNAYKIHAESAGFYEIPYKDHQVGDVILMNTQRNADHAGVIIGDNKILHHFTRHRSREYEIDRLASLISSSWQTATCWRHSSA